MLIIYAHPNIKGHCSAILNKIKEELKSTDTKYETLDLYKENFNPVLGREELYTHGRKELGNDVIKYQELLKKHDKIIIIYPTWWNGTPAILKGFFDRVLTAHFGFKYVKGLPIGLLKGKIAVITTTGGPVIYQKIFAKDRSIKTVVNSTLKFCGYKAKGFMIGSANKLTDRQKVKIDKTVGKVLNYLK